MSAALDSLHDRVAAALWPAGDAVEGAQLFAVVDGARDPRVSAMIRSTGLEHTCLFAGRLAPELEAAAPHLVHLSPHLALTRQLFDVGLADHWGVLARVAPDVGLDRLARHFRTLLRVRDEAGRFLMFRFYDPRVLRVYLPTCTDDEARRVFGPVDDYVCGSGERDALLRFARPRWREPSRVDVSQPPEAEVAAVAATVDSAA